ncbi:MAG: 2TM domain-containing protein [Polyangiales bacterium]
MTAERRFSEEEVEAILRRALERQRGAGGLTRAELLEAARGVGLAEADIDAAIREADRGDDLEGLTLRWRAHRRRAVTNHAIAFVVVNALLFVIDRATPPDDPWFHFPLIAWGIALALDALSALRGPPPALVDEWRQRIAEATRADGLRVEPAPEAADAAEHEPTEPSEISARR